jgi:hypothetical protein
MLAAIAMVGCDEREASDDTQPQAQVQSPPTGDKPPAPTPRDVGDPSLTATDADAQTAAAQTAPGEVEPQPIYDVLGETVEAAIKVDTFDDLMERFTAEDRKRLGRVSEDALGAQTTALRDAWKQRFEGEFNIIDSAANFKAMTRIERLQPVAGDKERARVIIQPREAGQRPLELILVREDEKWRINLPDDVDRQKLQDALAQRLDTLRQQSANWTTDEIQAHRDVAYEALSAMSQPVPEKPNAKRGQPSGQ